MRAVRKKKKQSHLEEAFERQIKICVLPEPVREYVFHRFQFDFAWPAWKIFLEIDGGTYKKGAHVIGKGYERDCRKNNLAQAEGWVVLRADRNMVYTFGPVVKRMIQKRIMWKKNKSLPY